VAKKIIVADDSTTVQRVVKLILAPKGYDVVSCNSGKETLEEIKKGIPSIIFADAVMKDINGMELSLELKKKVKELASIPVVVLVNSFDNISDSEFKKSKAVAKLMKPFDDAQLLEYVEKYSSKPLLIADDMTIQEKHEWDMDSFERPEVPDLNDPRKTIKAYGGKIDIEEQIHESEPAQQVDDEFFTIPEDEIIRELGIPDPDDYKNTRTAPPKMNKPLSEESLSEEEARRLLEEFKLRENNDGTIKFDEDGDTMIADFSSQAKKSPVEKINPEPDMGLWSTKDYSDSEAEDRTQKIEPVQKDTFNTYTFDGLNDIPELEKELTTPVYNPKLANKEIEALTKEAVEKLVKEMLPQIAEKVIKEEISKIIGKEQDAF
jgi:CheY-like chemotaxis protein